MTKVMTRGRVITAALWATAGAQLAHAAMLRARRAAVEELAPLPGPGGGSTAATVVALADEASDEVTAAAAADLMERQDVAVVDLVPGDLPPERWLRWLGRVDPTRLRRDGERAEPGSTTDLFYAPGGVHEALALRPDVSRSLDPGGIGIDRGRLAELTVAAQRHAPAAVAVRIAPWLHASTWTPLDRWQELRVRTAALRPYGEVAPVLVGLEAAGLAVLTVAPFVVPGAGLAVLVTWSVKPLLVLASHGSPAPGGLVGVSLGRLVRSWTQLAATIAAYPQVRPEPPAFDPVAAGAGGDPTLFDDRVERCPWCGSAALEPRLDTTDLFQRKPGVFHLDRCGDCGHIFQNPRLSLAGLDFYYEGFYDGDGAELWEQTFAGLKAGYEGRVAAVDAALGAEGPRTWLDVGTGHGHFCLVARQRWPETRFDGLDLSDSVLEARSRGWIDVAHHGQFPELAGRLAGSYDVVSMNHYLEHTREPRDERAAAAAVLVPGGHLLIEGPDQASPWARLGRWWRCWFQPQHQHFITCENLVAELDRLGFDVVSVQRAGAGEGNDLTSAAMLVAGHLAGPPPQPWRPAPGRLRRLARPVVLAASAPAVVAAGVADQIKDAWQTRAGSTTPGNAYRVVARLR
jgi:SAM-dependent methyltransferase